MGHSYCRLRMGKTNRAQGGPDFAARKRTVMPSLNALERMHVAKVEYSEITFLLLMVLVTKRELVS